jgi:predicted RNase H-like HicB family nuclease
MPDASRAIRVEVEREDGGRWLAEVTALSGALAYGQSREEAIARVEALALRILAERLERGEPTPELDGVFEAA